MEESTKQPSFARTVMSISSRKLMSVSKRGLSRLLPKQPACISYSGPLTNSGRGDEDAECRDVWEAAETNTLNSWKSSFFGSGRMRGINLSFRRSFRDDSTDSSSERCTSMRSAVETSQGVSSGTEKDKALGKGPEKQKVEALRKLFTEMQGWQQESESLVESDHDGYSINTSVLGNAAPTLVPGEEQSECSEEEKPAGDDASGDVDSGKERAGAERSFKFPARKPSLNGVLNLEIPGSPDRQSNASSPADADDDEEPRTTPVRQPHSPFSGPIIRQVTRHELSGPLTARLPRARSSDGEDHDDQYPRKPSRSVTTTPRRMVTGQDFRSPNTRAQTGARYAGFNTPQAPRGAGFNSPNARASRAATPNFCQSVTSERPSSRPSRAGADHKSPLSHRRRSSADLIFPLFPAADDLTSPSSARRDVAAVARVGKKIGQRKSPQAVSDGRMPLVHTDTQ